LLIVKFISELKTVEPSFQLYEIIFPSLSELCEPLSVTESPNVTFWSAPAFAIGGVLGEELEATRTIILSVSVS